MVGELFDYIMVVQYHVYLGKDLLTIDSIKTNNVITFAMATKCNGQTSNRFAGTFDMARENKASDYVQASFLPLYEQTLGSKRIFSLCMGKNFGDEGDQRLVIMIMINTVVVIPPLIIKQGSLFYVILLHFAIDMTDYMSTSQCIDSSASVIVRSKNDVDLRVKHINTKYDTIYSSYLIDCDDIDNSLQISIAIGQIGATGGVVDTVAITMKFQTKDDTSNDDLQ